MPALNFKKQFADDVEAGKKTQTIRAMRVRPLRTDDRLYLYTGMRTSGCRKLGEAIARKVEQIYITDEEIVIGIQRLHEHEIQDLARADGFNDASEFRAFFRDNQEMPFFGQIIYW